MAVTPSSMVSLGSSIVDFELIDTRDDTFINLQKYRQSKPLLVAFICNHCPYVVHIIERLSALATGYQQQGVRVVFISSNDVQTHPADSPVNMRQFALDNNFNWPYLYDETQAVARAYCAECTPDFFLYNASGELVYRGRFDAATPGNEYPVTGDDLSRAVVQMQQGGALTVDQLPSFGCNIKWK
jgi:peroxiredoxin